MIRYVRSSSPICMEVATKSIKRVPPRRTVLESHVASSDFHRRERK
jgi:hypothetical protein